jgi:predicted DNA-binding protein (MmcQ/YjbR family)
MVTAAQFRALCLSLPGAEEKSHFGKADFRVANKIFAGFGEEPERGYFKARSELREELLAPLAGPFTAASGAWGQHGWTYVALSEVRLPLLRELVGDSWRLVAPARLVAGKELAGKESRGKGAASSKASRARSPGRTAAPVRRARKE